MSEMQPENFEQKHVRTISDRIINNYENEAKFDVSITEADFRRDFLGVFSGNIKNKDIVNKVLSAWIALSEFNKRIGVINKSGILIGVAPRILFREGFYHNRNANEIIASSLEHINRAQFVNSNLVEHLFSGIYSSVYDDNIIADIDIQDEYIKKWINFLCLFLPRNQIHLYTHKEQVENNNNEKNNSSKEYDVDNLDDLDSF